MEGRAKECNDCFATEHKRRIFVRVKQTFMRQTLGPHSDHWRVKYSCYVIRCYPRSWFLFGSEVLFFFSPLKFIPPSFLYRMPTVNGWNIHPFCRPAMFQRSAVSGCARSGPVRARELRSGPVRSGLLRGHALTLFIIGLIPFGQVLAAKAWKSNQIWLIQIISISIILIFWFGWVLMLWHPQPFNCNPSRRNESRRTSSQIWLLFQALAA